jgi:hypothetical protein
VVSWAAALAREVTAEAAMSLEIAPSLKGAE